MDNCKHETMINERRQVTLHDTLIIADCATCHTTKGVRREAHTDDEAARMAKLVASIKGNS